MLKHVYNTKKSVRNLTKIENFCLKLIHYKPKVMETLNEVLDRLERNVATLTAQMNVYEPEKTFSFGLFGSAATMPTFSMGSKPLVEAEPVWKKSDYWNFLVYQKRKVKKGSTKMLTHAAAIEMWRKTPKIK